VISKVNYSPWIEYLSCGYNNFTNTKLNSVNALKSSHSNDVSAKNLHKTLANQVEFNTLIYRNIDILQFIDGCNIRLKEFKMHIDLETDISSFSTWHIHSRAETINKIIIHDKIYGWCD
jgi:hypothetical protein